MQGNGRRSDQAVSKGEGGEPRGGFRRPACRGCGRRGPPTVRGLTNERRRDLAVRLPGDNQAQDLPLAGRQIAAAGRSRTRRAAEPRQSRPQPVDGRDDRLLQRHGPPRRPGGREVVVSQSGARLGEHAIPIPTGIGWVGRHAEQFVQPFAPAPQRSGRILRRARLGREDREEIERRRRLDGGRGGSRARPRLSAVERDRSGGVAPVAGDERQDEQRNPPPPSRTRCVRWLARASSAKRTARPSSPRRTAKKARLSSMTLAEGAALAHRVAEIPRTPRAPLRSTASPARRPRAPPRRVPRATSALPAAYRVAEFPRRSPGPPRPRRPALRVAADRRATGRAPIRAQTRSLVRVPVLRASARSSQPRPRSGGRARTRTATAPPPAAGRRPTSAGLRQPGQRRPQVGVLGLQPVAPPVLLGREPGRPSPLWPGPDTSGVGVADRRLLAARRQLLQPILADRLQHPEARVRRIGARPPRRSRLWSTSDESDREHVDAGGRSPRRPTASAASSVKPPTKTARRRKSLLLRRQQVVAPGDRVAHRPLARRLVARPAGQERQPPVQPGQQRRRRAAACSAPPPARSPAAARPGGRRSRRPPAALAAVSAKSGVGGPWPARRRAGPPSASGHVADDARRVGVGQRQRRDRRTAARRRRAGAPRLVTSTVSRGQAASSRRPAARPSSTCSKLSSTSSSVPVAAGRRAGVRRAGRSPASRTPSARAIAGGDQGRVARRGEGDEARRRRRTPRRSVRRRPASARRVLPTPPGPVRVTSGTSGRRSRARTAATSRSRPISGVRGGGGRGSGAWSRVGERKHGAGAGGFGASEGRDAGVPRLVARKVRRRDPEDAACAWRRASRRGRWRGGWCAG